MHLVSSALWLLVLVVIRLSMRVVKINRYDLLRHRVMESRTTLVNSLSLLDIIVGLILTGAWVFCSLFEGAWWNHTSRLFRYKYTGVATFASAFNSLRIVLANSRICLLEIDIDSDWSHIIERVFLVEWQTKIALVFHFRSSNMFLNSVWLVLARCNIYAGVMSQHIGLLHESLLLT